MKRILVVGLVACGSPPPPAPVAQPPPPPVPIDAASPDAGVPEAVANAPAWVFRFNSPGRLETWTLRYAGSEGMVVVESAQGTTRYLGAVSSTDQTLELSMKAGAAGLSLSCKPAKRAASTTKCNDTSAKKIDVLDCYHPDFKAPMTFALAPGMEYVTSEKCNGYRRLP